MKVIAWVAQFLFFALLFQSAVRAQDEVSSAPEASVAECEARLLPQGRHPGKREELVQRVRALIGQEGTGQMLEHFTLGTYNLENYRVGEWTYRKDMRARAILQAAPHVLIVQEVGSFEALQELNAHLGSVYLPMLVEGNKPNQHIGFMVRADLELKRRLFSHRNEPIVPGSETRLFNRDFPILRLSDPRTGDPIVDIGGVHLKSMVLRADQPDPTERRKLQVDRSVQIMDAKKTRRCGQPQLVAGDFQGRVGTGPEYAAFRESGFVDVFDTAGLAEADRCTHFYFPDGKACIRAQLDAILTRNLPSSAIAGGYVHHAVGKYGELLPLPTSSEELRTQGSDHSLVVGVFDLSEAAAKAAAGGCADVASAPIDPAP